MSNNCPKCSKNNDYDARYCIYCGQRIEDKNKIEKRVEEKSPYASSSARVVNLILDSAGYLLLLLFVSYCFSKIGLTWLEDKYEIGFFVIIYCFYFFFFELMFNKTPAKWVSKTKVKMIDNSKPKVLSIIVRTIARLIPIDFITFFGDYPLGLHDRLSKTMVVDDRG